LEPWRGGLHSCKDANSGDNVISDQLRKAIVECVENGDCSLNALAKRCEISQPALYRFAVGEKQPDGSYVYRGCSIDTADRIADVLGMRLTKARRLK
jgi:hypothetical protein